MAKKFDNPTGAPSQRMLRVAEEVRHALSAAFSRGDLRDPELEAIPITITEVRASPDLKHMTCFVAALGREVNKETLALLRRNQPQLRTRVAKAVRLKYAPELHFQPDTALDYAMQIDRVMKRPEVARDLAPKDAEKDDDV
ncbi:30S ribosome-binding factor RbfA [Acetobacteraceae bacterium H6797]|nr:30S ribosome-binding factor RbfA [Acetobacteraceae bacterium H6797]